MSSTESELDAATLADIEDKVSAFREMLTRAAKRRVEKREAKRKSDLLKLQMTAGKAPNHLARVRANEFRSNPSLAVEVSEKYIAGASMKALNLEYGFDPQSSVVKESIFELAFKTLVRGTPGDERWHAAHDAFWKLSLRDRARKAKELNWTNPNTPHPRG